MSSSVIHDLGFRHYDGERLGRGWIFRSLLVETLRGVYGLGRPARAKTMPWLLAAIMLMPAIVSTIGLFLVGAEEHLVSYATYPMTMSIVAILFVGGRAPYAVSRDLRDGVMPLYLSRPLLYSDYVWAKVAGLSLGVFAMLALPQLLLLGSGLLAQLPATGQFQDFVGGMLVSALVAVILSAISLAIAAVTPRRGLGVAAIVATLLIAGALAVVLTELMGMGGGSELTPYFAMIDPLGVVNGIAVAWMGSPGIDGLHTLSGAAPGFMFAAVFVAIVAACLTLLMRRYRKVGGV